MNNDYDLDRIISDGKLRCFIIGLEVYNSNRPEEDTKRWKALKCYYDSPSTSPDIKAKIKQEVLSLFNETDVSSKRISLILSRFLYLVECRELLIQLLSNQEITDLDIKIQNGVWVTISYFRIEELGNKLADYVTKARILKSFLLTSRTRLNEIEVSDDDLWRIELIANFYESSNIRIRQEIELQLIKVLNSGSVKIDSILGNYMHLHYDSNLAFFLRTINKEME